MQSDTVYQVASRPDEVNCNVHETLALTMEKDTEILISHKIKRSIRSSFFR